MLPSNPYPSLTNQRGSAGSQSVKYTNSPALSTSSLSSQPSSMPPSRPYGTSRQQYYPSPSNASSTTSLLNNASTTSLLPPSVRAPQGAQPAFMKAPQELRSSTSTNSLNQSPYSGASPDRPVNSIPPSISDKFSLSADPSSWGADLSLNHPEPDDYLHNPDPKRDRKNDKGGSVFTARGCTNLGFLVILGLGLLGLFAGYPVATYIGRQPISTLGGFNLGGTNATGQVPSMPGNWGLIDLDTPQSAYTKPSFNDGSELQLVFSDEFNTPGRTFYPGDDPYWEAADLYYWATGDLEWYDPAALTTKDGALEVTMTRKDTHDLNFQSGMMSTWNKFCFTGGLIEVSVVLPGANNVAGFWPAIWTMGNLGRAGYGASLDGMWPYSYDACDVGTAPNQTKNGLPPAAITGGDRFSNFALSFLPGQRLSRCTCPGESHPGPMHKDGTYVGRSAPEIDVFEAQITGTPLSGQVSLSAQWAPFNAEYIWFNTTDNLIIADPTISVLNTYRGSALQQSTSVVTNTDQNCYELEGGCFSVYGFEYQPGFDNAYISWIADNKLSWTLNAAGMAADSAVEISARPVPQEPMYIIINLGMSRSFGVVDLAHLTFPATMKVDYVRVYQRKDAINIGCDPPDFPTQAYINEYIEAYTNPNLTTWVDDFNQPIPKNSFLGQC